MKIRHIIIVVWLCTNLSVLCCQPLIIISNLKYETSFTISLQSQNLNIILDSGKKWEHHLNGDTFLNISWINYDKENVKSFCCVPVENELPLFYHGGGTLVIGQDGFYMWDKKLGNVNCSRARQFFLCIKKDKDQK